MIVFKTIIYNLLVIQIIHSLTITFHRSNVTFYDTNYFEYAKSNIRRYSRKSPYYFNAEYVTKHTWNNNVTVTLLYCEYLHNEYRPSFVQSKFKFCDLLTKSFFIGPVLTKVAKLSCPMLAGYHLLPNLTFETAGSTFPSLFPFAEVRILVEIWITKTERNILKGYVDATFGNLTQYARNHATKKRSNDTL